MGIGKFALKVVLFTIPWVIAWGVLEHKLAGIPNSYTKKRHNLEQQTDSIQALFLGTSHTYHGVNPDYFSCYGYNLADYLQTIYYDKRLTLKYIDKMPRLKVVAIEVCYFSLYYQIRHHPVESWRDYFYSQYWGINYKDLPPWDMKRYSKVALYTPDKVREYLREGFRVDLAPGLTHKGYMPLDSLPAGKQNLMLTVEEGEKRIKLWQQTIDTMQFAAIAADLEDFVKELRARKIEVIFLNTPALPVIIQLCDAARIQKNKATIDAMCTKYNCRYFDYFTDTRFGEHDYSDVDHFNVAGARHFSEVLNAEVLSQYFK